MEDPGILFVDDSSVTVRLMETIFRVAGLSGHCAQSGEEALYFLRSRRFRLLITDWQMPGLNGLELARRAKRIDPELQVVLATAGVPPTKDLLLAAGISSVLSKPFKMKALLKLLRPETDAVA